MKTEFRAWHKNLHCYVNDGVHYGPTLVEGVLHSDYHDIEQFIGLTDKNGNKIYVGDILQDETGKFRVYSVPGGFGINAFDDLKKDFIQFWHSTSDHQTAGYIQCCEVIGNIHENRELLGG